MIAPMQRTLGDVDLSEFTTEQRAILREVVLTSSEHPIPLSVLAVRTHQTIRECKARVEELRSLGQPIGARRGKPNGIYYCRSAEELEQSARPLFNQGIAMIKNARKLIGRQRLAEWLGQQTIDEVLG